MGVRLFEIDFLLAGFMLDLCSVSSADPTDTL